LAKEPIHPGPHIRTRVLPEGMSVTEAAHHLGVGRPALSNLLNANAALSPDMAGRLERAFPKVANARELLDMQAAYDAARAREKGVASSVRGYVPRVLDLTASDLEDWAGRHKARGRLAVLLRMLIHSTGAGLTRVDFPGNDDSERPGWDGFVEAQEATPWIPAGRSGWEFGVNKDIKRKADKDYRKALVQNPAEDRAKTTFVFATPRRWRGKDSWRTSRLAEGQWQDVRVLDASDLEQWLERSASAQVWLADELGKSAPGVASLDECWNRWAGECKSILTAALFEEAIELEGGTILAKLAGASPDPVVVASDSRDEALAFLSCLFSKDEAEAKALRDRVVVFTQPGPLARLAASSASFVPVIASPEVEEELAPHHGALRSILVYPRHATTKIKADVVLQPPGYAAFEKALREVGLGRDEVERLGRESGRSLTVLRRRLSRLPGIRAPRWANDARLAAGLVPFFFAGAWKDAPPDRAVLELLAHDTPYAELEGRLTELLKLDDAPVWLIKSLRGLVSQIDTLFAVSPTMTERDLERFFEVAKLVLSDDDPSLDLPEEQRWMAGIYGKTRELSAPLREGIGDAFVLLSVHGDELLGERVDVRPSVRARLLVREVLTPLTVRKLEAQSDNLPLYAEAAPEEFLDILAEDLNSPDPESLKLMRPVTATFGRCPRTGLLWALENTAWAPERLLRTVDILARLAGRVIDDNWSSKPSETLNQIFRCWLPQTSVDVDGRIRALDYLIERHPKVAWPLCVAQFDWRSRVGGYSKKPRWRLDGLGHGEPATRRERHRFAVYALECALAWKDHTHETLGDLVELAAGFGDAHQKRMWKAISTWSDTAPDEDKALLRDKVRVFTTAKRARKTEQNSGKVPRFAARDQHAYEKLKPKDLVLEHAWLFRTGWIRESGGEERVGYRSYQEQIDSRRLTALSAVLTQRGIKGALQLAEVGEAEGIVGWILARVLPSLTEQSDAVRYLIKGADGESVESVKRQSLISGLLANVSDNVLEQLLAAVSREHEPAQAMSVLLLAPFRSSTWRFVQRLGSDVQTAYWKNVIPMWGQQTKAERVEAVGALLAVSRPRAAFVLVHFDLDHLRPQQLFRLMMDVATSSSEAPEAFRLDPYRIAEGFDLLTKSGEIAIEEMASLEYAYIEVLDGQEAPIPNLERHIEEHPELFVQAVVATSPRSDDAEDPEEWQSPTQEIAHARARKALTLLENLSRIPGHGRDGAIEPARLRGWVRRVREICAELARTEAGDRQIGALLSRAPVGRDGVWPCEPVREVLDEIANDSLCRGLTIARYNSRGVHMRGEAGHSERALAAEYATWASAMEFTHPRVARILRELVAWYEHDANEEDYEARVRNRLLL
jgi:addiction module HigA family antidote